jgi:hypothetical protein
LPAILLSLWLQPGEHIPEFGFSAQGLKALCASLKDGDKSHGFLAINDMPVGAATMRDSSHA